MIEEPAGKDVHLNTPPPHYQKNNYYTLFFSFSILTNIQSGLFYVFVVLIPVGFWTGTSFAHITVLLLLLLYCMLTDCNV